MAVGRAVMAPRNVTPLGHGIEFCVLAGSPRQARQARPTRQTSPYHGGGSVIGTSVFQPVIFSRFKVVVHWIDSRVHHIVELSIHQAGLSERDLYTRLSPGARCFATDLEAAKTPRRDPRLPKRPNQLCRFEMLPTAGYSGMRTLDYRRI